MDKIKNVTLNWPESEPYSLCKLRELIGSLTMPEKNAFKRHIRGHSDNNHEAQYVRLFDCVNVCLMEVERQKKQDPAVAGPKTKPSAFYPKFIARHRSRRMGHPREVGPMANYLHDRILDALRFQNTDDSKRLELYARLLDIQLLIRKGLHRECSAMIQHAKKLAIELEALPQLLELTQIEFRLAFTSKKKQTGSQIRSLYADECKWLRQLETMIHLRDLRGELLLVLLEQGNVEGDAKLRSKLNFFIQYVNDDPPRQTFDEEHNFQSIMAYLIWINQKNASDFLRQFLNERQPESIVYHLKAIVELYDRYPERKREDPRRYRDTLFNYLGVALAHKAKVNMADYAGELDSIPTTHPDFLRHVVSIRLIDYIEQKDFIAAKAFLQTNNVWQLIERPSHQHVTSRMQTIRYLAGTVYFVREEHQEAVQWFQANTQRTIQQSNAEAVGASALYLALARFELGFATSTAYRALVPPLREYFPYKERDDSFEYHLLKTLEAVVEAGKNVHTLQKIAGEALPIMTGKAAEKTDSSHYGLFLGWLESKHLRRPLRSVLDKYI